MAGTKAGGVKARKTNILKYGKEFYRNIGRIGGSHGHTGGFASNPELAREIGAKAGKISKKGLRFIKKRWNKYYYEDKLTGETVVCRYDKETDKIVRIKKGGDDEE